MRLGYAAAALALLAVAIFRNSSDASETCPELEKLRSADAHGDAKAVVARGESLLLMLGGFVGVVPGGADETVPTVLIEGTEDTSPEMCQRLRGIAEDYARRFNETVRSLRN